MPSHLSEPQKPQAARSDQPLLERFGDEHGESNIPGSPGTIGLLVTWNHLDLDLV